MNKIVKILVLSLVFVLIFGAVASPAYVAYDTYTYSISGKQMLSPAAYSTNTSLTSTDMGLKDKFGGLQLDGAEDIVTDELGNVYIADAGNNRIVVLNKYYGATKILTGYVDENGKPKYYGRFNQGVVTINLVDVALSSGLLLF